jgi:hypothetical protein
MAIRCTHRSLTPPSEVLAPRQPSLAGGVRRCPMLKRSSLSASKPASATHAKARELVLQLITFAHNVAFHAYAERIEMRDIGGVRLPVPPPPVKHKQGRPPGGDRALNLAIAGAVVLLHECTGFNRTTNRSPSGAGRATVCSIVAQALKEGLGISKTPEAVAKISERHRAAALPLLSLWERHEKRACDLGEHHMFGVHHWLQEQPEWSRLQWLRAAASPMLSLWERYEKLPWLRAQLTDK